MGQCSSKYSKYRKERPFTYHGAILSKENRLVRRNCNLFGDSENADTEAHISAEVTFDGEFLKFAEEYPDWKDPACVLFFSSYSDIDNLKVMRRQHSGLCCMHAPVVLQHYHVSISKGRSACLATIDIASYIGKFMTSDDLWNYRMFGLFRNSVVLMTEINYHVENFNLIQYHISKDFPLESICEMIMDRLKSLPALVSNFAVDYAFATAGTSFLSDTIYRTIEGYHSMVMIGGRKCPEHKFVFLLQNWWDKRYFIEVSAKYVASGASICFVDPACEIRNIPDEYPVILDHYAETDADVGETWNEMQLEAWKNTLVV